MSESPEASTQVAAMRDVTRRLGTLHEAQVLQLKLWPRVAFETSTSCTAKVSTVDCVVDFHVRLRGRRPAKFRESCEVLARSVRALLGDWWLVKVTLRGEKVYQSRRGSKPPAERYAGTDFGAGKVVPEKPWQFRKQRPS